MCADRLLPAQFLTVAAGSVLHCRSVQVEDAFGPVLLQKKHPVLKEWLQRELKTVDTVCRQLAAQPENERITIRMAQVQEKRQLILEALKRYSSAIC